MPHELAPPTMTRTERFFPSRSLLDLSAQPSLNRGQDPATVATSGKSLEIGTTVAIRSIECSLSDPARGQYALREAEATLI